MACIRESPVEGRLGTIRCDEEGCQFARLQARGGTSLVVAPSEADCVLQLRLRAGESEEAVSDEQPRIIYVGTMDGSGNFDTVQWLKDAIREKLEQRLWTEEFEVPAEWSEVDHLRILGIGNRPEVGIRGKYFGRPIEDVELPEPDVKVEPWAELEDPADQLEAFLGIELEAWQRDWVDHVSRGERLRPVGSRQGQRYRWVPAPVNPEVINLNEAVFKRELYGSCAACKNRFCRDGDVCGRRVERPQARPDSGD